MKRLLIATTNPAKLREIRRILDGSKVDLLSLRDFAPVAEPEETGATFEENARLKALYYDSVVTSTAASLQCGPLYTVAEDSGLVIDALDGAPGVHSARFLRPDATYPERFEEILRQLDQRPSAPRTARFVGAVAVVHASAVVYEARGVVEGEIARTARGDHGFGYDPIFFYAPLGQTLGETSDEEKDIVGHRGKAFRQLASWLGMQNGEQKACPPFG